MATTNGGQQRRPGANAPQAGGERGRSSTCWRNTSRISRSRIRTRRARCSRQQQPQINIQINVNAKPLAETDVEVELKLEGKAEAAGSVLFSFELVYAGMFRIQNVPQDSLQPVMMIECPRLLFPFAREIIATAVRNGGFPPLLLDPVDFVALYRQSMAAGAAPADAGHEPDVHSPLG